MITENRARLKVMHIGAGRYRPRDRDHVTYGIWRELAFGFADYHVVARSCGRQEQWSDGNLHVALIESRGIREAEFLFTQINAVPIGLRIGPDVIVCQSPILGGLAAIVIARFTGAKILMELHSAEFFLPSRFGTRLWLMKRLARFALHRADRIRVLSPPMAEAVVATYGPALARRIRVVAPRVDLSRFGRKAERDARVGPLRIAMVGAVNSNKGQLRLAHTLRDAPFPIELHTVGDGSDLRSLREFADELRSNHSMLRIIAHGPLPHYRVADVLSRCDLFVMYSRTEATPRAIMEAMAVGLPIITTDAGFCADIVEHAREGFILGADPDIEIVRVLEQFRADPKLARRMGSAAVKRARRDYDSTRLFEDYRRLIEETALR